MMYRKYPMILAAGLAATLPALAQIKVEDEAPTPRRARPNSIRANLSRNHPDYGMTPEEHAAAKAARGDA